MRVNIAIPEAHVSKPVLDAALESVTRLNEELIKGGAPTSHQLLEAGATWRPEPPGQEHFDHAGILAQRGHGDCDDWAPLHAATLRATGKDPGAVAEVVRSGPHTWHAIVKRSDGRGSEPGGTHDDPSKMAGMGREHGIHGAVLPLMSQPGAVVGGVYIVRPSLAVRPSPRGFQARVDLPWHWREHLSDPPTPTDYAMTALHSAPVAPMALTGAIVGAIELANAAGFADPEHLERLACISDACEGCPQRELEAKYGPEHAAAAAQLVGSFFGDVFKAATSPVTSAMNFVKHPSLSSATHMFTDPLTSQMHVMQPFARAAAPIADIARPFASFIPGVGPVAMSAFDAIQHGPPTSLADAMQMAMHAAPNFIPGGSMLSPFMQQFAQQQPPPQMYPQQMPQQWPRGFQ